VPNGCLAARELNVVLNALWQWIQTDPALICALASRATVDTSGVHTPGSQSVRRVVGGCPQSLVAIELHRDGRGSADTSDRMKPDSTG
jgi:hypothetical protein